ncbi:MAG: ferrous iron transport protein B [Verrucomicrobia bacterium]|nr:ferrous iron transport protein B [Verrucomicrobiota bacterium]
MPKAPAPSSRPAAGPPRYVVLTGNPNCGKTTLFNALTGLRAKVGNYPGVTVERKEGRLQGAAPDAPVRVLDLPGAYSLTAQSLDEQIARDVLFHRVPEVPPPDLVVVVVDASNLQRNLYYATQVIELGYRTILALNMIDVARENGHEIDPARLAKELALPVLPVVANARQGIPGLRKAILDTLRAAPAQAAPKHFGELPPLLAREAAALATGLEARFPETHFQSTAEAALILSDETFLQAGADRYPADIRAGVQQARERLERAGLDWRAAAIEARYTRLAAIADAVTRVTTDESETRSDRLDRVLTHPVWGLLVFALVMVLLFQGIFSMAELPMAAMEHGAAWVSEHVSRALAPGPLHSLLVDGVIAGVGAVVVFLPQICLLFLFLGLLEDTGYMARAAFLMDRLMNRVGLHGKSFIPLLSSFACAIPGIMATRTIESPRDRLVTILVAPLMSCSARLPVYTLLIAACIPDRAILGFLRLPALTLLGMYGLGIVVALGMAWLFKRTLLKGPAPMLIMELPPYKRPLLRVVCRHMWDRARLFLQRAGTVILGINILLWFLATYPKNTAAQARFELQRAQVNSIAIPDNPEAKTAVETLRDAKLAEIDRLQRGERLQHSVAGRLGRWLEPVIAPLGFDWKIGIGIVASFAAREIFVSTMSIVYNVSASHDPGADTRALADTLLAQRRPDGTPLYTPLVGLALMVFYVFALQCVSTVVIVRRETQSWRWPLFQWLYMSVLAWAFAFVTYQGGRLLGLA